MNLTILLKMKNILTFAFILVTSIAFAQGPPPHDGPGPSPQQMEKIKTMKIGFLTEKLNLSSEEAKTFWPVYNKYQDELEVLRRNHRDNIQTAKKNFDEMSDKDIEKTVDGELAFRQNELDVMKKYNPEFKKILSMKKVAKLYRAEEDFKRKLIEQLQERRQEKKENRRGGRIPMEH
jgi:hypothetical protein